MRTYISKFEQGIVGKKTRDSKMIDISISIGDEVVLKGEYYVSKSGSKWKKENVENNPDWWEEKIIPSNK